MDRKTRLIEDDSAMNIFMNDIWSYTFTETRNMTYKNDDCWSGDGIRYIWNVRNSFLLPVMRNKPIQEMSILNG